VSEEPELNRLHATWSWWVLKLYLRVISGKTRGWDRLVYRLDRDERGDYRVWLQVIRGRSAVRHLAATSRSPLAIRGTVGALLDLHLQDS
jgi:hypothetical protein